MKITLLNEPANSLDIDVLDLLIFKFLHFLQSWPEVSPTDALIDSANDKFDRSLSTTRENVGTRRPIGMEYILTF